MGEGAVDVGGPRREFYRLLASQASDSDLFTGREGRKFFACNILSIQVIFVTISILPPLNSLLKLF